MKIIIIIRRQILSTSRVTLTSIKLDKNVTLRFFFRRIVEADVEEPVEDDVDDDVEDVEIEVLLKLSQLFDDEDDNEEEFLLNK